MRAQESQTQPCPSFTFEMTSQDYRHSQATASHTLVYRVTNPRSQAHHVCTHTHSHSCLCTHSHTHTQHHALTAMHTHTHTHTQSHMLGLPIQRGCPPASGVPDPLSIPQAWHLLGPAQKCPKSKSLLKPLTHDLASTHGCPSLPGT